MTHTLYHLLLAITSPDSKYRLSRRESGCLNGVLMAIHPATFPSTNGVKEKMREPNLEWTPREVSAGAQKDFNVLTNKIHGSLKTE